VEREGFPDDLDLLTRAEPVYDTLPGWRASTREARSRAELPAEARAFLDRHEELVGVPIGYVSVGSKRDQIIRV
jgi:adenylosuccinate synthase